MRGRSANGSSRDHQSTLVRAYFYFVCGSFSSREFDRLVWLCLPSCFSDAELMQ